jgi:hypothetical protein
MKKLIKIDKNFESRGHVPEANLWRWTKNLGLAKEI